MIRFLKNILQLLINPARGWADIAKEDTSSADICRDGFYPLLGVTALSSLGMLMHPQTTEVTLVTLLQSAIITFTAFFATMFLAEFAFSTMMRKYSTKGYDLTRANSFVIYNLAILAIIAILGNLLPPELIFVYFMPAYVIYIMWRGRDYMEVSQDYAGSFMMLSVFSVLLPVFLIQFVFNMMLA